ncbi:MAG: hypothetical protein SW833_02240 [Cyanobacteriota bacterium]|nr:hypothetical protein [Cyanobacteriota bacterium]
MAVASTTPCANWQSEGLQPLRLTLQNFQQSPTVEEMEGDRVLPLAPMSVRSSFDKKPLEVIPPVPSVLSPPDIVQAAAIQKRLVWFDFLSRAIAVGFLAGAGFVEIYVANPTFQRPTN